MAGFHCMSVSISTENFLQNAILNYLDSFKLACLKMESNFFMVSLHMTPKKKNSRAAHYLHNIIDNYLSSTFIITVMVSLCIYHI